MKTLVALLVWLFVCNSFAASSVDDCAEGESFLDEVKECVDLKSDDEAVKEKIKNNEFLYQAFKELERLT